MNGICVLVNVGASNLGRFIAIIAMKVSSTQIVVVIHHVDASIVALGMAIVARYLIFDIVIHCVANCFDVSCLFM